MMNAGWSPPHRLARRLVCAPVDVVTGRPLLVHEDLLVPGPVPLLWQRIWSLGDPTRPLGLGPGLRHSYDRTLQFVAEGLLYTDEYGLDVVFPPLASDGERVTRRGLLLERVEPNRYRIIQSSAPTTELRFPTLQEPARVHMLISGEGWLRLRRRSSGRLAQIDASSGARLELDWADDRITNVRLFMPGESEPRQIVTYGYDERGMQTGALWSDGRRQSTAYDERGRLVAFESSDGHRLGFSWDGGDRCATVQSGEPLWLEHYPEASQVAITTADGGRWIATHDGRDLTHLASPEGEVTRWHYDEQGDLVSEEWPDGTVWEVERDWSGAVTRLHSEGRSRAEEPQGLSSGWLDEDSAPPTVGFVPVTSDPRAKGGPLSALMGLKTASNALPLSDLLMDLGATLAPPGTLPDRYALPVILPARFLSELTTLERLDEGLPTVRTDHRGRALALRHPGGSEWSCERAPDGAIVKIETASRGSWEVQRNPQGRVTALVAPRGTTILVERDQRGRPSAVTAPDGRRVEVSRSGGGRPVGARFSPSGRIDLLEWSRGGGALTRRDGDGRLLTELAWGPGGLLSVRRFASGDEERYRWDDRGRLVGASSSVGELTLSYDDSAHRLTSDLRDGEGVATQWLGAVGSRTTVLERFETLVEPRGSDRFVMTDPSGATVAVHHHGLGLLSVAHEGGLTEYRQYGPRGQRIVTMVGSAELPEVAEPLPEASEEKLWAPLESGASWERDGRARVRVAHRGSTMRWFEYDEVDRLVLIRRSDGREWQARWDALDRLVECRGFDGVTRRFWWDGPRLAAEVVGDDGPVRLHVYAHGLALVPLAMIDYESRWSELAQGVRTVLLRRPGGLLVGGRAPEGAMSWSGWDGPPAHGDGTRPESLVVAPGAVLLREVWLVFRGARCWDRDAGVFLQPLALDVGHDLIRPRSVPWSALLPPTRPWADLWLPPLEPERWPEVVEVSHPASLSRQGEAVAASLARMRRLLARDAGLAERFESDLRDLERRLNDALCQSAQPTRVSEMAMVLEDLGAEAERLAQRIASVAHVEEETLTQELSNLPWQRLAWPAGPPRVA